MTNYNYDFWKSWKKKNTIEDKAIAALKEARQNVIDAVPTSALIAIYIKGSFARREMNF